MNEGDLPSSVCRGVGLHLPFDCERIVDSGVGWLITMEK